MGKKDNATKLFFSCRDNFLSVIRFHYGWDVQSEGVDDFSERLFTAVEEVNMIKSQTGKKKTLILEKNRDVVRRIRLGTQPLIMGIENQQMLDSSEPIRVMLYDSMEYEKQRRVIKALHREKRDLRGSEYVAGFAVDDMVVPVHTLIIYFGKEPWERPKNLADIWERTRNLPLEVLDYPIDVLDVRRLTDEQIDSIESDVRLLFGCVKYDEDSDKMNAFVEKNRKHFVSMLPETFLVIATMTESQVLQEKMDKWKAEGERMNMCKAFEEWKKEAERIGLERGMQQGMQQGIQQGIHALIESCKDLGATKERIMELLNQKLSLEESECKRYVEMYW